MEFWTLIVMFIFLIGIAVFVVLTFFTETENAKNRASTIVYPFSGQLTAPSPPWKVEPNPNNPGAGSTPQQGMYLTGMRGGASTTVPQIQCPAGSKINIIGAFVDVFDPYGQCSTKANSVLEQTCGYQADKSSGSVCTTGDDSTCPPGMTCSGGRCAPKTCSTHNDCAGQNQAGVTMNPCGESFGETCSSDDDCGSNLKCLDSGDGSKQCLINPGETTCMACIDQTTGRKPDSGQQGTCAVMPFCMNTQKGLNKTCSPVAGDHNVCRPRDATAYLAAHCDGKTQCLASGDDFWNPNDPSSNPFGPLPCRISAKTGETPYATLPAITGWGGGKPTGGERGDDSIRFSQGYNVHGVYTCVPADENTSVSQD